MKAISIAVNTFREAIRSNILHAVIFFAASIILISALFGSVSIGEQFLVVKSFGYAIISISGMICTLIAGVVLFQKEITNKTIYNILSKPVKRHEFLLGKLLGLILTSSVLVTLMMLALSVFLIPMEGVFDVLIFQALFSMYLEIIIVASITILFSSVAVTPILPGIFTLAIYVCGKSISYLEYFLRSDDLSPILIFIIKSLRQIIPDLEMLTPYDQLLYGVSLGASELMFMFIYAVSYALVIYFISSFIFNYREI